MGGPSDKSIEMTVCALHSHSTPMNMRKDEMVGHPKHRICLWHSH